MNGLITRMAAEVRLCTTTDIARKYAVDTSTVRRWVADKKVKPAATTPGGQYRFDPEQVARDLHAANLAEDEDYFRVAYDRAWEAAQALLPDDELPA